MKNHAASVRAKLKNQMKQTKEALHFIELQYVQERFLYRLSLSSCKEQFILKGGTLFYVWAEQKYRPTKDLDFMFYGDLARDVILDQIKEICAIDYPEDGINFVWSSFTYEEIKEAQEYDGLRINFTAKIGSSKIAMYLDICTGDKITPAPLELSYPKLLAGFKEVKLKMYPKETVIAEKVHAMISLDLANSRMKDYFDVYILITEFSKDLSEEILIEALTSTFSHRKTEIPTPPAKVWTSYFYNESIKINQWKAFLRKNKITLQVSLEDACTEIGAVLNPLLLKKPVE
ncbi:nucleotidyl transferase AbiEii/AbiGii toxin family protein [Lentisphaera marina]|uniref:nucleotidyl transferase AbiEii/AbiGii toxin family protein n=1 Tax=Lentisphaera marina TaxID=1111041 RepID=UPI00236697A9|nr:nucleotidyl transferase AbiEii/AbiGii toxin family protein [Lentisphaera marina]MDD7985330.1 nucleotidyl transferase AbiEii/AbiGii toxin family protein [Lentisphaera marina]